MLKYNTQLKDMPLPEYGRIIQNMVDHCCTLQDKEERNQCANAIISIMERLFPSEGDAAAYRLKLWDHLAIMSDFSLDIDWPEGIVAKDTLSTKPEPIAIDSYDIKHRQYGRNLEQMIEVASQMEPSPERDALVLLLANQMKKAALSVSPEGVEDERIFKDLRMMSHGALNLTDQDISLFEYKAVPVSKKKKKK